MSGNQPDSVAPVATDIVAQAPEADTAPVANDVAPLAVPETVPETLSTEAEVTEPAPAADTPVAAAPEAAAPEAPAPEVEIPVIEVPAAPVKAAETPAVVPAPAKVTAQSGGAYVVQLLALQDRSAATKAWNKIAKKHSGILAAHALDIEEADLGAKGTWYRVRAAGFSSKSAATSACAKLKAAGQDCITKKR